jgi:hypothetical protein
MNGKQRITGEWNYPVHILKNRCDGMKTTKVGEAIQAVAGIVDQLSTGRGHGAEHRAT